MLEPWAGGEMSYLEGRNRRGKELDEPWNDIGIDDLFDGRIPLL